MIMGTALFVFSLLEVTLGKALKLRIYPLPEAMGFTNVQTCSNVLLMYCSF
jgi:hypothetical protein